MADQVTKVVLDLDNSEFMTKLRQSLGLLKEFGDGQNLTEMVKSLAEMAEIVGVVGVAILAVKEGIDLTVEAEKINQVTASFNALAKSAGLSAEVLKNELTAAAHGLVSETDLLQSANKAIIAMGENAGRIPQVMELARKATIVFGGDLISNFENINRGLATGNTRMLKRYGLVVDASKAEDAYAKSLGVSREYLDDNGKRLAVMNAAMEQGAEKFKDIDEKSLKATNSLKQIGATFKDLGEIAVLAWGRIAGPAVSSWLEKVAGAFHEIKVRAVEAWGGASEKAENHKTYLEQNTQELEKQIALYRQNGLTQQADFYSVQLAKQKAELAGITQEQEKAVALEKEKAAADGAGGAKGVDTDKLLKARQKFEADLAKIHKERVDTDVKVETDAEQVKARIDAQSEAIRTEAALKIAKLDKELNDAGIRDEQTHAKMREDINKKADNDILKNEQQLDADRIKALKNYEEQTKNTSKGIVAGFRSEGEQARQNFTNMAKFGHTAFSAIGSNATSAFEALGNGSKNAADALKGFFFGAMGDIAEQQGEIMLLMGLWPPNPVAIAAGGALIALGAALKSVAGGSSSGSSGAVSGGGSAFSPDVTSNNSPGNAAPSPQAAEKKTVTVAIQGNYFETDQTRNRLMEMIREAGDFTDFQLKQIGQP